jgi:hypothetical protein
MSREDKPNLACRCTKEDMEIFFVLVLPRCLCIVWLLMLAWLHCIFCIIFE